MPKKKSNSCEDNKASKIIAVVLVSIATGGILYMLGPVIVTIGALWMAFVCARALGLIPKGEAKDAGNSE